jgi:hypothetical protein
VSTRVAVPELDVARQVGFAVEMNDPGTGVEQKKDVAGKLTDLVAVPGE